MNTEHQFAPNRFQHCSTISSGPPGSGTFIAFYTGDAECHKSQHVQVQWISPDGQLPEPLELEEYTGNPQLVETIEGTRLIYSKFEKLTSNRIEWWQYCSLWDVELRIDWQLGGKPLILAGKPTQIVFEEPGDEKKPPTGLGYLPRCNPIWIEDGYLLPLYRENAPHFHGVILYSKDGKSWEYRGAIGKNQARCIQPTIWYDRKANKIKSLLRKFSRDNKPYAYYSESDDMGATWSPLKFSAYYNANNSILAVGKEPHIIWNNDPTGRDDICLSTFGEDKQKLTTIAQLDGYGSYPSACVNGDKLQIAYTAKSNALKTPGAKTVIKLKEYDLEAVIRAGRKDTTWPGFSQVRSSQSHSSPWQAAPRNPSPKTGPPSQSSPKEAD